MCNAVVLTPLSPSDSGEVIYCIKFKKLFCQIIFPTFLHCLHSVFHILHKYQVNNHCDIFAALCHLHVVKFVKFQVKPSNFDGMSKRSAVILNL